LILIIEKLTLSYPNSLGNCFEACTHTGETTQPGEDEVQYAETGFFIQNGQKRV